MNIHAALTAHIQKQNEKRTRWEGEIGGQALEIFARPRCPADNDVLKANGVSNFLVDPSYVGMAVLIAHKAENAAGQRIFNLKRDLPLLKQVEDRKIDEIYAALFFGQDEAESEDAFEERVGNSDPT